jgi:putative aldouronate transport system permease protein
MSAIKKTASDRAFDIINTALLALLTLVMIYPLYFTLIASISEPYDVVNGNVFFWPVGITMEAYSNVFQESRIWLGYRNTIIYTVSATLISLALTLPSAYVLSKKKLVGRNLLATYFIIPMYFGGGLIPTYLQVRALNLLDKPYTLIVLGCLSVYNVIVTRVFFQTSIPDEIYESTHIDGASDFRMFFQIALPLAKPIIAVMALFYAVGRWNDYFQALIYTSKADYQPLQMVLRGILLLNQKAMEGITKNNLDMQTILDLSRLAYIAEAMKYSMIFIASAPLLIAYPFVQKYFVKGIMIGSLKG